MYLWEEGGHSTGFNSVDWKINSQPLFLALFPRIVSSAHSLSYSCTGQTLVG